MAASYPKPDGERRNRSQPAFGWTVLSSKPRVKVPSLPDGDWTDETLAWWAEMWSRPQAAMWDPTGITLRVAARLHDAIVRSAGALPALSSELRQIEDRHGLSPKAMLQLRWRVGELGDLEEEPAPAPAAPARARAGGAARRRRLLRAVEQ